jgi:hypothetical protein
MCCLRAAGADVQPQVPAAPPPTFYKVEHAVRNSCLHLMMHCVLQETAFSHKYPQRPRHEWGDKLQKYRPPGSSSTAGVSLRDMVSLTANYVY